MSPEDIVNLTATEAAAKIAANALTAEELASACLERIEAIDDQVGAFVHLDRDYVLKQAQTSDDWRRSGRPLGPLHGVPVAIKDIIDTGDYPTEYGSPLYAGRRPRTDASLVARLRSAGAIILGKTVTTEFAYFHPGKTKNPRALDRTPGGSSSGSAAAVAAGMVPMAFGTQTNGSIIRPASFCGVFGMKPSHGLVSRHGILPLSRTLDHPGPFARSLDDIALAMDVIAGFDAEDPDTRHLASRNFRLGAHEAPPLPPRYAFVKTPMWDKADADTREAFGEFAGELGEDCIAYDLSELYVSGWEAQRVIMAVEMAHNLGKVADQGGEKVSQRFHDLMAEGRKVTASQYLAAQAEAARLRAAIEELFQQEATAIITPATRGVAPKGLDATGDPVFCTLWSLLGLPAVSLPLLAGEDGLPLGVQLIGAAGDDARLLRTARALVARFSA